MKKYDLVIGGAGMFGSTLAYRARRKGKKVLVIERDQIGGHCAGDKYSRFGVHIFHTSNRMLWDMVNQITPFRPVHYSPLAQYNDEIYSFPINKLTLHQMGINSIPGIKEGRNFEELAINYMGWELYEKFFYHYTYKMWGRAPSLLPAGILKRIPVRTDYRTSYFDDTFVGVPQMGYDAFFDGLLDGVDVQGGDFVMEHHKYDCPKVFTGSIDELYGYKYGELPYRGMKFAMCNPMDAMVTNYTDRRSEVRKVDYSYLWDTSVAIKETPSEDGRFYPVPWGRDLYDCYDRIDSDVICAGRLGSYRYMNMNDVMEEAIMLYTRMYGDR